MSDELEIPVDLLEMKPLELAENDDHIKTIVEYLKSTRENIRATEAAGKRITSKAARTKPKQFETNVLDLLVKET